MTAGKVTKALGGRWHGTNGTACCPAHDDKNPSLSITEHDGTLLVHCHAGCSQEAVWASLKRLGLVGGGDTYQTCPQPVRRSEPDREAENRAAAARTIWAAAVSATGTPVERYLRSRGITIPPPPTLRYHPSLTHGPTDLHFSAMVAAVQTPNQRISAIHRTFLLPNGSGKAQLLNPKLALGRIGDGAVRLGPVQPLLGICEGVETGLSGMQLFDISVWCALGARLDRINLPPEVRKVVILADNDQAGMDAAKKAVDAFTRQGRHTTVCVPEDGDFNDVSRRMT